MEANTVVVPGDVVLSVQPTESVVIGPGLTQLNNEIVATKGGILRRAQPSKIWIDSSQKRYVPVKEDSVIGVITDKMGETYRVDIGAAQPATLSFYAFEGATKKNRPNLQVGALILGRLSVANKDMEAELVCTDASGKTAGFGELVQGYVVDVSTGLARRLSSSKNNVLQSLAKRVPFEMALGMNGRVWVKSTAPATTIAVARAVSCAEFMTQKQADAMVSKLFDRIGAR
eukprot:Colp12_sorted_trinity150504_noHs@22458